MKPIYILLMIIFGYSCSKNEASRPGMLDSTTIDADLKVVLDSFRILELRKENKQLDKLLKLAYLQYLKIINKDIFTQLDRSSIEQGYKVWKDALKQNHNGF